jgi:Multiubiquitin
MESEGKKAVTIIVNGVAYDWSKKIDITYAEVVTLDVPDYPQHPEINYSVKYKNGHGNKPEGTLSLGGSVKVKDGMVFTVSSTGQS